MRRRTFAGALAALALAGCPLPQPLPDYPKGTVTPPRIVMDTILVDSMKADAQPIVFVPAGCTGSTKPSFSLSASLFDANTLEQVEARWFVDYAPNYPADTLRPRPRQSDLAQPSSSTTDLSRTVPQFLFQPYDYQPAAELGSFPPDVNGKFSGAGIVHVVELVVSNGFDPSGALPGQDADPPFRGPAAGFETQTYRWTFVNVVGGGCPQ